jgi:hypothetical protein
MSFFTVVPTYYVIYVVVDSEVASLSRIKECKTKGEAVKWIHKSGEKGTNYCIKEFLRN